MMMIRIADHHFAQLHNSVGAHYFGGCRHGTGGTDIKRLLLYASKARWSLYAMSINACLMVCSKTSESIGLIRNL